MNRRAFITALASAAPVGLIRADQAEDPLDQLRASWESSTVFKSSGTFLSEEKNLRLEVALIDDNDKVTEEIVKSPEDEGDESVFTFQGTKLPRWLRPSDGLIKSFKFFWDEKEIPLEKRFWNDFGGCSIEESTLTKDQIPEAQQYSFANFLESLDVPKLILSADGGTALIEWRIRDTDACCGHRATVRWIISKSGTVLRHRHTTPSGC